jgi:hypothetical protein
MGFAVFKTTAKKAKTKTKAIFAFGRHADQITEPDEAGGFVIWKLCVNHDAKVPGGLAKTWRIAAKDLTHDEAVALMNKKLKFKAWHTKAEKETA